MSAIAETRSSFEAPVDGSNFVEKRSRSSFAMPGYRTSAAGTDWRLGTAPIWNADAAYARSTSTSLQWSPRAHDQCVQAIVEGIAGASREDGLRQVRATLLHVEQPLLRVLDSEDVDRRTFRLRLAHLEGLHRNHPQPCCLQNWHEVREDQPLAAQKYLELRGSVDTRDGDPLTAVRERDRYRAAVGRQGLEFEHIGDRDLGVGRRLVRLATLYGSTLTAELGGRSKCA